MCHQCQLYRFVRHRSSALRAPHPPIFWHPRCIIQPHCVRVALPGTCSGSARNHSDAIRMRFGGESASQNPTNTNGFHDFWIVVHPPSQNPTNTPDFKPPPLSGCAELRIPSGKPSGFWLCGTTRDSKEIVNLQCRVAHGEVVWFLVVS